MKSGRDFMIVTNNPLVEKVLSKYYEVRYLPEENYRAILITVRDLVYAGHKLYTHPLSGSVKPNETPYKSVVVSKVPHKMNADEAAIIPTALRRTINSPRATGC